MVVAAGHGHGEALWCPSTGYRPTNEAGGDLKGRGTIPVEGRSVRSFPDATHSLACFVAISREMRSPSPGLADCSSKVPEHEPRGGVGQ